MSRFTESKVWGGGEGTGDVIEFIGPSIVRSPHKQPKPAANKPRKLTGTVRRWNTDRGFGWIRQDGGQPDIFVHVSDLRRSGIESLSCGELVKYEVKTGKDGKIAAYNLEGM